MKPECENQNEMALVQPDRPSRRELRQWLASIVLGAVVASGAGGCRICNDCEDMAYPAYGGSWTRTNRDSGRVASLFDPAGAKTSALTGRDLPLEEDEQERSYREGTATDDDEDAKDDAEGKQDDDPKKDRPKIEDFDEQDLEELEDEKSNDLKDLDLDDIEVKKLLEKQKQERAKKIF